MKYLCSILVSATVLLNTLIAQTRIVSLSDVLEMSNNSAEAIIAHHTFRESYWEYEIVKAELLPELSLAGTLPQFNRSFSKTTLPDGKEAFVSQFYGDYSVTAQLTQNIPYTNTQIFVSSGLERLDLYGSEKSTSYLSSPVGIGISQSLFTYNADRWQQKINPVKYNAAKQRFLSERERIYTKTVTLYFDLLTAQEKLQNALTNKLYADTLAYIAQEKYLAQKIIEADYLQVELVRLQADYQITACLNAWQNAQLQLKNFLQSRDDVAWKLQVPNVTAEAEANTNTDTDTNASTNIGANTSANTGANTNTSTGADISNSPQPISVQTALEQATNNNALFHEFKQRKIEAQSNIMRAKTENRFSMDIYASFGLNQNTPQIREAYKDLSDQEVLSVGLRIPILDWGKSGKRIKIAKSQREVLTLQIEQEQQDFERNITLKVLTYNTQKKQLSIAQRACDISDKRLEAEKTRYILGSGDFTRLHDAITDKDNSLYTYLESLKTYWELHHEIRQLTLYDFEKNKAIDTDFRELIRQK